MTIKDAALAELCKRSLYHFYLNFWCEIDKTNPLVDEPHIKYICDWLQQIIENVEQNIEQPPALDNQPPSTGKSTMACAAVAWDKNSKTGYVVKPVDLTYPAFRNRIDYKKGAIVGFIRDGEDQRFYYEATQELVQTDSRFDTDDHRIPNPSEGNEQYWRMLNKQYNNELVLYYKGTFISSDRSGFYQEKKSFQNGDYHYFYAKDTIVRHDWTGFYRAKYDLESNLFPNSTIPAPTIGASNDQWEKVEGYDYFYFAIDESTVIDEYTIGTDTTRVRYHTGYLNEVYTPQPDSLQVREYPTDYILFDVSTPSLETQFGELKIIDLLIKNINEDTDTVGSVAVIATSPSQPITYTLSPVVNSSYIQTNNTGIFENLPAGKYKIELYDNFQPTNRYTSVEFEITNKYKARWRLKYNNRSKLPLEVVVYQRDFDGEETLVTGNAKPVALSWKSSNGANDYLAEGAGAELNFNLLTSFAQQFADTALFDNRMFKVKHFVNNKLVFTGFIDSKLYEEAMLGAGSEVTITATCGLGALKEIDFLNYYNVRQTERTSMLSIILKLLNMTGAGLNFYCGVNLREKLMSIDADPLAEAFVYRSAYNKKDSKALDPEQIIDCRTVLDAIVRLFNGQIYQANGAWHLISFSEEFEDHDIRLWSAAGTLLGKPKPEEPLHILSVSNATAERELYFIDGKQTRTTTAAANAVQVYVTPQLATNLFANGDFVEWNLDVPTYWSRNDSLTIKRTSGEKNGEDAVLFTNYTKALDTNNYLLSPPAKHFNGVDEDAMIIKYKALVKPTTSNPGDATVTMYFQIVADGNRIGSPVKVDMTSKDKWKEYTVNVPYGLIVADTVRVEVIQPEQTSTAPSVVLVNSVAIAVQPGLTNWSDFNKDQRTVINKAVTNLVAPAELELVHADLPLLPGPLGAGSVGLPAKKADGLGWLHGITLVDLTPTTAWKRPNNTAKPATFLDVRAQDALAFLTGVGTVVTAEVRGRGLQYLHQGMMLDMADEALDGKFIVTDCELDLHAQVATITCRKLVDNNYSSDDLPNHVRIANKHTVKGYRIAIKKGKKGYRIGKK